MRVPKRLVFLTALWLACSRAIAGHHSLQEFESSLKAIEGTLVEVSLKDPHSTLVVAIGEPGTGEQWQVEWISALVLGRQGIGPDTLHPGDRVIITGNPSRKTDARRMWLRTLVRPQDSWRWTGGFH